MGFCVTDSVQSENRYKSVFRTHQSENRLIKSEPISPVNGDERVEFKYDYMGRRFEKKISTYNGSSWSLSETRTFIYDNWNMICESVAGVADPGSTNYYVWGLDLSGSLQAAGGIGGLISVTVAGVGDPGTYYSAFDANGNVTDYLDAGGTNVAHYDYAPFGGVMDSSGAKKDDFVFKFSTKYLDEETGLSYYGYRYYDADMGRWPSRDPIGDFFFESLLNSGLPFQMNVGLSVSREVSDDIVAYRFVNNSPINRADLLGLKWTPAGGGCAFTDDTIITDDGKEKSCKVCKGKACQVSSGSKTCSGKCREFQLSTFLAGIVPGTISTYPACCCDIGIACNKKCKLVHRNGRTWACPKTCEQMAVCATETKIRKIDIEVPLHCCKNSIALCQNNNACN